MLTLLHLVSWAQACAVITKIQLKCFVYSQCSFVQRLVRNIYVAGKGSSSPVAQQEKKYFLYLKILD